jgi:hypothetical protein
MNPSSACSMRSTASRSTQIPAPLSFINSNNAAPRGAMARIGRPDAM